MRDAPKTTPESSSEGDPPKKSIRAKVLQLSRVGKIVPRPACERAELQRVCEARPRHLCGPDRSHNSAPDCVAHEVRQNEPATDVSLVPQQETPTGASDVRKH